MRSLFHYLYRNGRVESLEAIQIRNPKQEQHTPRALNVDETCEVLDKGARTQALRARGTTDEQADALQKRDLALAELLYGSGLRISEALDLNVQEVDPSLGYVRVMGKGRRERLCRGLRGGDHDRGPRTCRRGEVGVAVDALAGKGNEEAALGRLARVDDDLAVDRPVPVEKDGGARVPRDVACCHGVHRFLSCRAARRYETAGTPMMETACSAVSRKTCAADESARCAVPLSPT